MRGQGRVGDGASSQVALHCRLLPRGNEELLHGGEEMM